MLTKIKDFFNKHHFRIFFIAAVLIGFTPLLWFKGYMIAGEEFYALNYLQWGELFKTSWFAQVNYGHFNTLLPFRFQWAFFKALNLLHINTYFSLIIWHIFTWTVTSVSFYILGYTALKKLTNGFILFIGTFYYLYTPYFLNISPLLSPPRLVFMFLPIISYFLYKDLEKDDKYYLLKVTLVLFFASPTFVNIPSGSVLLFIVYLYILFKNLLFKFNLKKLVLEMLLFTTLFVATNLWWMLPVGTNIFSQVSFMNVRTGFTAVNSSKPLDVLSLFGSWAFREKVEEFYYFPYNEIYDAMPLILVRFLPFLIIVSVIYYLLSKKDKGHTQNFITFNIFLYIIFVFLSKGTLGLWSEVFDFLYKEFPMGWMYREPYAKFIPVAALAAPLIMVYGVSLLVKFLIQKQKNVFLNLAFTLQVIMLLIVFYIGHPYFKSSNIIWNINRGDIRSYIIKVPEYWKEFARTWQPQDGYYILYPSLGFNEKNMWESGYSGNPYLMLTNAKTINERSAYINMSFEVQSLVHDLYNDLHNNPQKFLEDVKTYNISGIVFQNDVYESTLEDREKIKNTYKQYLTNSNENIDVYTFNTSMFSYLPKNSIVSTNYENVIFGDYIKDVIGSSKYIAYTNETNLPHIYVPNLLDIKATTDQVLGTYRLEKDFKDFSEKVFVNISPKNTEYSKITYNAENINEGDQIDYECCKNFEVIYKDYNVIETEKFWHQEIYDQASNKFVEKSLITKNELELIQEMRYVKELKGFTTDKKYLLILDTGTNDLEGFISILQKDVDSGKEEKILEGVISGKGLPVKYALDLSSYIRKVQNPKYYISIQSIKENQPDKNKLQIKTLELYEEIKPQLLLSKENISQPATKAQDLNTQEYIKINDSIYLINNSNYEDVLQFKQSYNKFWYLFSIDENKVNKWKQNKQIGLWDKIYIYLDSSTAKKPINIDGYSNGWELDNMNLKGTNTIAIIYMPSIISDIFMFISILFTLLSLLILNKKPIVNFVQSRLVRS